MLQDIPKNTQSHQDLFKKGWKEGFEKGRQEARQQELERQRMTFAAIMLRCFPQIALRGQKYVNRIDCPEIMQSLITYVSVAKSANEVMHHLVSISEDDEQIDENMCASL